MESKPANDASKSNSKKRRPRYQKIRELGRAETRVTYLAKDNQTGQSVVIRQFIFAQPGSYWAGFAAYEHIFQALRYLEHPGIPAYLDFLPTRDGFCTVREYKEAHSLAEPRPFDLEEFKQIAVSLLEILIYLQDRTPPVMHLNIKPENVLVDDQSHLYLVDFGVPYIKEGGSVKYSTAGTSGFMPREQLRNREITPPSDLYGLGATLSCLLSQTPSTEIGRLKNLDDLFSLASFVPPEISFPVVEWLEKLLQPYASKRYPNAAGALAAFNELEFTRSPSAKLQPDSLEFTSTKYGEHLSQTVTVINDVPHTILQGSWELAPHPNEPKRRSSAWISFAPALFENNQVQCEITVNTSKLMANKCYEREVLLHTNGSPKTHSLKIEIQTPLLITEKLPWISLGVLSAIAAFAGILSSFMYGDVGGNIGKLVSLFGYMGWTTGIVLGSIAGIAGAFSMLPVIGSTLSITILLWVIPLFLPVYNGYAVLLGYMMGAVIGATAGTIIRYNFGKQHRAGLVGLWSGVLSMGGIISLLTAVFSVCLGISFKLGLVNLGGLILVVTGILLGMILFRFYSGQAKTLANYRKFESRLIKP